MKNLIHLSLFLLLTISFFTSCVNVFKVVDIRQDEYKKVTQQDRARVLLLDMGKAHGIENWKNIKNYQVNFEDEFYGFLGKRSKPFKEAKTSFKLSYEHGTSNGSLEITSGKQAGDIWSYIDGETSYIEKGESPKDKKGKKIKFWVPTYQYFIEFPARIQEADALSYQGTKTIENVECEGVLASWNTTDKQKDIDQYLIWINKDSKQIVKVEYTVREQYKFLEGAAYFRDLKEYNGILFPSKMPVVTNLKKSTLHEMRLLDFNAN